MMLKAQTALGKVVFRTGLRERTRLLEEREARYAALTTPAAIAAWQLAAFNRSWREALRRYRFYADWQRRHGLPDALGDIRELAQFPILRKADLEANAAAIAADARPCHFVGTGGSTGPSTRIPRGPGDAALETTSMYLGRAWAGIRPGDPIVLIWGHEHLDGFGLKGRLARAKRWAKDFLINQRRLSVYRLDGASVARYFAAVRARPGAVLVGYVSAVRQLLDHIERAGIDGHAAQVRAVIFCSETVFPRDLARVRALFGCPALIEYGMGELGVMAYSGPETSLLTFLWDAVHCELGPEDELLVTSLQPMRFPLVNFGTGDRVEPVAGPASLPFRCARILGRTRTVLGLTLRDGRLFQAHSELFEDSLDLVPAVRSYLIHQRGDRIDVAVRIAGTAPLAGVRRDFLAALRHHAPDLDDSKITFSALTQEPRTIAGKRQYVLRE